MRKNKYKNEYITDFLRAAFTERYTQFQEEENQKDLKFNVVGKLALILSLISNEKEDVTNLTNDLQTLYTDIYKKFKTEQTKGDFLSSIAYGGIIPFLTFFDLNWELPEESKSDSSKHKSIIMSKKETNSPAPVQEEEVEEVVEEYPEEAENAEEYPEQEGQEENYDKPEDYTEGTEIEGEAEAVEGEGVEQQYDYDEIPEEEEQSQSATVVYQEPNQYEQVYKHDETFTFNEKPFSQHEIIQWVLKTIAMLSNCSSIETSNEMKIGLSLSIRNIIKNIISFNFIFDYWKTNSIGTTGQKGFFLLATLQKWSLDPETLVSHTAVLALQSLLKHSFDNQEHAMYHSFDLNDIKLLCGVRDPEIQAAGFKLYCDHFQPYYIPPIKSISFPDRYGEILYTLSGDNLEDDTEWQTGYAVLRECILYIYESSDGKPVTKIYLTQCQLSDRKSHKFLIITLSFSRNKPNQTEMKDLYIKTVDASLTQQWWFVYNLIYLSYYQQQQEHNILIWKATFTLN